MQDTCFANNLMSLGEQGVASIGYDLLPGMKCTFNVIYKVRESDSFATKLSTGCTIRSKQTNNCQHRIIFI